MAQKGHNPVASQFWWIPALSAGLAAQKFAVAQGESEISSDEASGRTSQNQGVHVQKQKQV